MIEIRLDEGNVRSVLTRLSNKNATQAVVNAAAESYTDDVLDCVASGRSFKNHTGQLEQSIGWHGNNNGTATVFANAKYAPFVEFGTRPHVIRPKPGRNGLRFSIGGRFIVRRSVNHPGSKPYPFFYNNQTQRMQNIQTAALSVLARLASA